MQDRAIAGVTALVTGASRGFGRGIAAALTGAGAQVVGVARDRGALEELRAELGESFTVHGWDIVAACGADRPVPPGLASALLPPAALLVTPCTRLGLFADPVRLPGPACPGDQLVAFLGRQPRSPAVA